MSLVDDMIEEFNNQNYGVLRPFGSSLSDRIETFFKFLEKRGRLSEIDVTGSAAGDYQNELLLHFYENDLEKFYYWLNELLVDVEFDNGSAYIVAEPEDFSNLFCDSRDVSKKTIENILTGNIDFDWYSSYEIEIFQSVIDELNETNLKKLKEIFVRELQGIKIEYEDEELEVTSENIEEIFKDDDLVEHILDEELNDLKFELKSLYHNSEQNALESEYYDEVWSELGEHFDVSQKQWVSVRRGFVWDKDGNKKEKYVDKVRIPILNFEKFILDFLNGNKNYGNTGTLEYQGSFVNVLSEDTDCLRVRFPDYADSRKIEENINEMFNDYIH